MCPRHGFPGKGAYAQVTCRSEFSRRARKERGGKKKKPGSSGTFMSGDPLSSIFLAQRRGGAEKKSSEPYNSPDHSRQGFGMGLRLPSSSPRLCASARKIETKCHP